MVRSRGFIGGGAHTRLAARQPSRQPGSQAVAAKQAARLQSRQPSRQPAKLAAGQPAAYSCIQPPWWQPANANSCL